MQVDLVIIGAGPAGMAAAVAADNVGLNTILLDEQPSAGGQIYRNIEQPALQNKTVLGKDYYAGANLAHELRACNVQHICNAVVWQINPDGSLYYSRDGVSKKLQASHILIATGAQERPMPIPGWTLPGVMTAGSAQIMLKTPGLAAENAVFAGSGPLLYLITWQYLQAGLTVKALIDTTPKINYLRALTKPGSAVKGLRYLFKGLKLIYDIRKAGIPVINNVSQLEALGDDNGITEVTYKSGSKNGTIKTNHLFLHQGVIPGINLSMASGCKHYWNDQQLCWQPETNHWGQSSQPHISITGDGSYIGGAISAELKGRIAALHVAFSLGKITELEREIASRSSQKKLDRELGFRPFIDTLYQPATQFRKPLKDEVVVCRCEGVKVKDIRDAAKQGCMGPNQLKSFTRSGMGSCQGRQCGLIVSEMMSDLNRQPIEASGYYRLRAPIKPLSLNELAMLAPNTVNNTRSN